MVLDADDKDWQTLAQTSHETRRIDVWWLENDSSRLALLFGYLMTRNEDWDEATLRLLAPTPGNAAHKLEANLRQRLSALRIDAEIVVVPAEEGDAMYARSADASFVLLPLRLEGMSTLHPTGGPVDELFSTLPVVAMVAAAGDVKLKPDEEETPPEPAAEPTDADA